jgi:hypothetical protein
MLKDNGILSDVQYYAPTLGECVSAKAIYLF